MGSRPEGIWFTTADLLSHLDIPLARRDRSHEMRVGAVLRQLGCERQKRWNAQSGKSQWGYSRREGDDGNFGTDKESEV